MAYFADNPNCPSNFLSGVGFQFSLKKLPGVSFYCQSANVPSQNLSVAIQPTRFNSIPEPGDEVNYDDLTVRFLVDEDLKNYMSIHNWIRYLGHPESSNDWSSFSDGESYTEKQYSDGFIFVLDSNFNKKFRIYFKDLFPVSLSGLNFDSTYTDTEYFAVDATFKFTIFDIEEIGKTALSPESYPSPEVSITGQYIDNANTISWVKVNNSSWNSFMNTLAVFPSNTDPLVGVTQTATWEVRTTVEGNYTLEVASDNEASYYWDDVLIGTSNSFTTISTLTIANVTDGLHNLKVEILNTSGASNTDFNLNPAGVAFILRDSSNNRRISSSELTQKNPIIELTYTSKETDTLSIDKGVGQLSSRNGVINVVAQDIQPGTITYTITGVGSLEKTDTDSTTINIPSLPTPPGPIQTTTNRLCIAIIDESDSQSVSGMSTKWTQFRQNYPDRIFYLLHAQGASHIETSNRLMVPAEFLEETDPNNVNMQ